MEVVYYMMMVEVMMMMMTTMMMRKKMVMSIFQICTDVELWPCLYIYFDDYDNGDVDNEDDQEQY